MPRSHFATNQEGWNQTNQLANGQYIKLNAFTPLADSFGGSTTISASGWGPHSILWNGTSGNWIIEPNVLMCSGLGSIHFYNDYDISNRSSLTGINMSAVIQLGGNKVSWRINDFYIYDNDFLNPSGCDYEDDYTVKYGIHSKQYSYTSNESPSTIYLTSDEHNCISHPVSSAYGITINSASSYSDIDIEVLDNPSGNANISNIYYDHPRCVNSDYPNIVQITVDGLGSGLPDCDPTHYSCGCSTLNGTYITRADRHDVNYLTYFPYPGTSAYGDETLWDTRNVCAGPTVTCPTGEYSTYGYFVCPTGNDVRAYTTIQEGSVGFVRQSFVFDADPETEPNWDGGCYYSYWDWYYPSIFINPLENDRMNPSYGSYDTSNGCLKGFISGIYSIDSEGKVSVNSNKYYHPHYGILNVDSSIFDPRSSIYTSGDGNAIISGSLFTPTGYTNIGCVSDNYIGTGIYQCSHEHCCVSLLDPSKYNNGIVYIRNYSVNFNSGLFILGRMEYIYDNNLYSIASGETIDIVKNGYISSFNKYLSYDHGSGSLFFGNTNDDYYLGQFSYSPVVTLVSQNSQQQLVYPYGTLYQNISTYRNLDDFTVNQVDYEFGKGINLLKLIPSGDSFEFYCKKYYEKPTTYHKLQPYLPNATDTCDGDNTASPLLGVTFVGTQTNTYTSTTSANSVYHSIYPVSNEIDIVYKFNTGRTVAVPNSLTANVMLSGTTDTIDLYAYNFIQNEWNKIGDEDGVMSVGTTASTLETYNLTSDMSLSGVSYIRYHGTGIDDGSRLGVDFIRLNYKYPLSPYKLMFDYNGNIAITTNHTYQYLPIVSVAWSGDWTKNAGVSYEITDIRPAISGDGTKIGFDNVYPDIEDSYYWYDEGLEASTSTSGNVLTVFVDPAGDREDFSFYYRDNYYTHTHDYVDISGAMGRRWFIVYKDDQLVAYSGNQTVLAASYTQSQINAITGTGLLVSQYYINPVTPSFNINPSYIDRHLIDGFSRTWTMYPYINDMNGSVNCNNCCTLGATMTVQGIG